MAEPAWPDLVWAAEHDRAAIHRAQQRGTLNRLGTGLYTGSVSDEGSAVIRRNYWTIVARLVPGAVIVGRCARSGGLPVDGTLTVIHDRRRPIELPGLMITARRGPGPQASDILLPSGLYVASEARVMLESLANPGGTHLDQQDVERWIDELCGRYGEAKLAALRDTARVIAAALRVTSFPLLQRLITAALATGTSADATTPELSSRSRGNPVDAMRLRRFEALASFLRGLSPRLILDAPADAERRTLLPFYEAYFSNFIEGTEFTVEEAAALVSDRSSPTERRADAHDVRSTFDVVSDTVERRTVPTDAVSLVHLLQQRHRLVMGGRPDKGPGEFKHLANRAGSSEFVAPNLVLGTLSEAFTVGQDLVDPFQRAVFLSYVVAEVHPFLDGNGRLSRIIMNAELTAGGQVRIIIPTVYRLNYISSLKAASNHNVFAPLVAVLEFTQAFTARLDLTTHESAHSDLTRTHALRDPYEAEQSGVRLLLP